MVRAGAPPKPTTPFRPRSFAVSGPSRGTTTTRPRGPIYGQPTVGAGGGAVLDAGVRAVREIVGWEQPGKTRPCWDLTITADGHRWYDRHHAAGRAQAVKEQLEEGFRRGLDFDPETRRFVVVESTEPNEPTVLTESLAWWRAHWSTIEPKSRQETLRYISRPMLEMVADDAGPPPPGLTDYLTWQLLPPKPADQDPPPEHKAAAAWLHSASLPIRNVDVAAWQAYSDRWRTNRRTGRPLATSSYTRHLADVRQMWAWVCTVHQLPNPWPLVKATARSSAGRRSTTVRPVDRTIVLAPEHVRELAGICGKGPFGPLAEVYVLLLGIGGGRPGESAGVETADLDLPAEGMGEVRFRRTTRRGIDPSFLDADDDADWGPLKGREIEDSRTAPLPSRDTQRVRRVIIESAASGPLFGDWDWEKFSRDVWVPARSAMVLRHRDLAAGQTADRQAIEALCSALGRLRPHDLRHAACSMWLNTPGMEVRVACEWSGHKRLSVFLDIYQGLMPGSEGSAKARLDETWGR